MSFTTASTSVVLVPTATSNAPFYIYLNNVSTAGRIVTVRDNDGYASLTNQIIIEPRNGAYFQDGSTSITINQPYGYVTFNTALNGGYGVLNTFGFPAGSSAAFVSNVTSCNFTTSTIGAQFISAPTAVFNLVNTNTISTGTILVNNFTPSTITANSVSTGIITGGSLSFQTIFGSTIATNGLTLASLTATTGNFTNINVATTTATGNLAFTGDVLVYGSNTRTSIGTTKTIGSRSVVIGSNAGAGSECVAIGISAGGSGNAINCTHVGIAAGFVNASNDTTAIGAFAGNQNQQQYGTAVGRSAGNNSQQFAAVAVGPFAGATNQQTYAVALGAESAYTSQGAYATAIGSFAGNNLQGASSIAIGVQAGFNNQGGSAIAIGPAAGQTNQHANTTIINASSTALNSAQTNSLYIAPIRDDQTSVGSRVTVYYNQTTKEITTGPDTGTNLTVSTIVTSSITTNILGATQITTTSLQTNTLSATTVTSQGISSLSVSTATTLTGTLQANTISSGSVAFGIGNISTLNTNELSTASLSVGSLNVNNLSTGSISLGSATIASLQTNTVSTGTITANSGTISTFTAGSIVAETERVGSLSTNFLSANIVNITGPTTLINSRTQNIFVANGDDGAIDLKYSLDGVTWCNSVTNGAFTGNGSGVAWNGSLFVAVGSDAVSTNTIKYSSDGSNWFNSSPGGFTTGGTQVAWNGRMWVATGQDATSQGRIKYSFNGSNWSNANTTTFSSAASKIAWGNGVWVVAGVDAGGTANSIMTSTDGSNWSFATNTTGARGIAPAYNGSLWLMGALGSDSNAILFSSNATVWSRVQRTAFTTGCYGLGWNGSYWVAVGQGGATIQTSQNGMVWTAVQSGQFNSSGENVTWNGMIWVAGGNDTLASLARIKTSRDGSNWTNSSGSVSYSGTVSGIVYTNQLNPDVTTQQLNLYSQNVPNTLQSTNQILALTSSIVLNNTLTINQPANSVGINASIPQAPLHVVGGLNGQTSQIMLQTLGSTLNTSMYISTNVGQAVLGVVGPSNGFLTNTIPGDTVLTTAQTTNRLVLGNGSAIGVVLSNSQIGIGTTAPDYTLDVVGSSRITSQQYIGFSNTNTGTLRLIATGGSNYIQSGSNNTNASGNTLMFGTINNTATTMTINTSTQQVGIGTTTPSTILHINGGSVTGAGSTQFMITGTGGNPNTAMNIRNTSGQVYLGVVGNAGGYITGSLSGDTFIRTDETLTTKKLLIGNGNGTPGFTLSNNWVGINQTSPSYPLHVNGTIFGLSTVVLGTSPGTAFNLQLDGANQFGSPISGRVSFGTDGTGYQMRFSRRQAGTYADIMTLTDGCNVGIGTTSPAYKLDVNGTIRGSGNIVNVRTVRLATNTTLAGSTASNSFLSISYTPVQTGNVSTIVFANVAGNINGGSGTDFASINLQCPNVSGDDIFWYGNFDNYNITFVGRSSNVVHNFQSCTSQNGTGTYRLWANTSSTDDGLIIRTPTCITIFELSQN